MQQQVDEQPLIDGGGVLSLSLIHEVLEYIHIDMKRIIHRQERVDGDNDDNDRLLPLSLIMNGGLEDYFEGVLLSARFKWKLCDECAKRGQLNSLIWARSKGCPWNEDYSGGACYVAAEAGHLHILQWAREHGCEWDSWTCYAAARLNLQVKNMNLSNRGSLLATLHPGGPGPRIRRPRGPPV